jgi:5-methylcytosine-specific restriction endonuclease McrA
MNCIKCKKPTNNPKFCSKACANAHNNHFAPKRTKTNQCKKCGVAIYRQRTYCKDCWQAKREISMLQNMAGVSLISEYGKRGYQRNSRIRDWARRVFAGSGYPMRCQNCGYEKHVETCHVRPINTFALDTPISAVNHLDNLIALCPNCHWELDHGLLKLDTVVKEQPL